uniref:Putative viral nucleocapsid n=1 Tax=Crithidia otongatchiensis leishbunyavirus CotoLBV1 TaxID=1888343 RepID=A0A3S6FJL3_9VIRU|nr:putative viral nucleocapsid [Crithidia otongatchiensis leishbunyavirus CotoLBV1]
MADEMVADLVALAAALQYRGVSPWNTRQAIIASGRENAGRLVAYTVGCRGTNLAKIAEHSSDRARAAQVVETIRQFMVTQEKSLGHIAAAFQECVYDARLASHSPISVNTLQFLKHSGLQKGQWLAANREFLALTRQDPGPFERLADIIWEDDSFAGVVGNRVPA